MNVLSLFDGMSCGRLALKKAGIPVNKYYASEIDKGAITISKDNWTDIVHIGDVCSINPSELPKIDIIFAGSPCQGFSSNGKQEGLEHKQSRLFWEFIRLLKALKPKYFLLENVSMKKEWLDIISAEVGCEPIKINSSLVTAALRARFYWTNIPNVTQPKDKGLTITDILEIPTSVKQSMLSKDNKAYCITATHANCMDAKGIPYASEIIHNTKRHQRTCILQDDNVWRMLTPVEVERLQTVPDGYTSAVPDKQRYKALGNGWTVDVIAHLLKGVKRKRPTGKRILVIQSP